MSRQPVLAIDLGGTEIKIGIVDGAHILAERKIPALAERGLLAALDRVDEATRECLDELTMDSDSLCGCGVAFAGLVDCGENRALGSNGKYEDAATVDMSRWAKSRWGLELVLDNDARMATVGEWQFGAGAGVDDLVVVTLGTGIGTGVVIDGRVLVGRRFRAGNLGGHIPLSVDSVVMCSCGNRACAESLASSWALRRDVGAESVGGQLSTVKSSEIGFQELFAAIKNGDEAAAAIAVRVIRVWSTLIVALIHAYDPDLVILTGNVTKSGDEILPGIRDYVNKYAWTPGYEVRVEQGEYPATAALLGAGYVVTRELNAGRHVQ